MLAVGGGGDGGRQFVGSCLGRVRAEREGRVNDVEVNSYGFIAGDVEPEF